MHFQGVQVLAVRYQTGAISLRWWTYLLIIPIPTRARLLMFSCSTPVDSNAVPIAILTANVRGTQVFLTWFAATKNKSRWNQTVSMKIPKSMYRAECLVLHHIQNKKFFPPIIFIIPFFLEVWILSPSHLVLSMWRERILN